MLKKYSMLVALVAVVVIGSRLSADEIEIGAQAPDFTAKTTDDKEISLKGALQDSKAVVIAFTCNNCPVAVAYEDRLIDFTKNYEGKDVKFLAINCNTSEDLEKMKVRAEEKGFNFPYAYEETGDAARGFGARVTPHFFVVDGAGKVVYRGAFDDSQKEPTKHYVADAVDAVLAGKAPETNSTKAFGCGIRPKAAQ
jgi:peroxiredoxin